MKYAMKETDLDFLAIIQTNLRGNIDDRLTECYVKVSRVEG